MKSTNDLYIEILKFGKSQVGTSFKFSSLRDHLANKGYIQDERIIWQFFADNFCDKNNPMGNDPQTSPPEGGDFYLEDHAYFNLLEYEELQEARESSKVATKIAIAAIVISIISTGFSIYFSILQLDKSTCCALQVENLK